jgi:hypothetical protein
MRSSLMSRSPFHSAISLALVASGVAACGDGDDRCGPGPIAEQGLVASSADVVLTFDDLTALAGNDCPDPMAPEGVISLSLEGTQIDGTGLITLCIPRPDLLMMGQRTIGTFTSMADVRIIDLMGTYNNCMFNLDTTRPPLGEASARGVCDNGTHVEGFRLDIDGSLSLRRNCNNALSTVAVTLVGKLAVAKRMQ